MFVWARPLYGTRISCPASVDPSEATENIHVTEIDAGQGVARACYHDVFHD